MKGLERKRAHIEEVHFDATWDGLGCWDRSAMSMKKTKTYLRGRQCRSLIGLLF